MNSWLQTIPCLDRDFDRFFLKMRLTEMACQPLDAKVAWEEKLQLALELFLKKVNLLWHQIFCSILPVKWTFPNPVN